MLYINIDQLTIELGRLMQGIWTKRKRLAEVTGAYGPYGPNLTFLNDELEIIHSILHQIWDMEVSKEDGHSWLDEVIWTVRRGDLDPNDLPDVIRNLKKNLDSLPPNDDDYHLDAKTGDIHYVKRKKGTQ